VKTAHTHMLTLQLNVSTPLVSTVNWNEGFSKVSIEKYQLIALESS
jgi:hypothetical protein